MQFPAMRRLSLTTGSAFLMVYALDDENSYEVLKMCMQELQEVRPDFQEIPIVFAWNKCDVAREKRKVSKEVVSNYVHYELPRLRAKVSRVQEERERESEKGLLHPLVYLTQQTAPRREEQAIASIKEPLN